jgi:hypothetical protein
VIDDSNDTVKKQITLPYHNGAQYPGARMKGFHSFTMYMRELPLIPCIHIPCSRTAMEGGINVIRLQEGI